jgi:hypothetical protein
MLRERGYEATKTCFLRTARNKRAGGAILFKRGDDVRRLTELTFIGELPQQRSLLRPPTLLPSAARFQARAAADAGHSPFAGCFSAIRALVDITL